MLFSISPKIVPHHLIINLYMCMGTYDISNRESLYICRKFLEGYTKNY